MMTELFYQLLLNTGLLLVLLMVVLQLPVFQNAIFADLLTAKDRLIMTGLFCATAILSTYTGIPVGGAIANTRVISIMLAGILGGPAVGFWVGTAAGIHRFLADPQGVTAAACCLAAIAEGILAGQLHRRLQRKFSCGKIFLAVFLAEALEMGIILALVRPSELALALVLNLALPMTVLGTFGICLLLKMMEAVHASLQDRAFAQTQDVLDVLDRCFPFLQKGYEDREAMQSVCSLLGRLDWVAAANFTSLTDHWTVSSGSGQPAAAQLLSIPIHIDHNAEAQLTLHTHMRGKNPQVQDRMKREIGAILQSQLQLAYKDQEYHSYQETQWDYLQAQINPHFFFNTLSTAASLCHFNPEEAYQLLVDLGDYFRKTLRQEEVFVDYDSEIATLKLYLGLIQKRFEDRLQIQVDAPEHLPVKILSYMMIPLLQTGIEHCTENTEKPGSVLFRVLCTPPQFAIHMEISGGFTRAKPDAVDQIVILGSRLKHYYPEHSVFKMGIASIDLWIRLTEEKDEDLHRRG